MAKIELSGLLNNITGSLSGSTFQRSQGGLIMRNKPSPVNRNSSSQSSARSVLAECQFYWNSLTSSQRQAWDSFLSYYQVSQKGNSQKRINGQQYFIQVNSRRLQIALSVLEVPSYDYGTLLPLTALLSYSASTLYINLSRSVPPSTERFFIYATPVQKNSIRNAESKFVFVGSPNSSSLTIDVTSLFLAKFGKVPVTGENVFYKVYAMALNSGITTTECKVNIIF